MRFDLDALTSSASALAQVPLFLVALLVVRGVPAPLYRRVLDASGVPAAALLQATSLPFIVTATMIGTELGLDTTDTAALVSAGMARRKRSGSSSRRKRSGSSPPRTTASRSDASHAAAR